MSETNETNRGDRGMPGTEKTGWAEHARYVWHGVMQYRAILFWGFVMPVIMLVVVPWFFSAAFDRVPAEDLSQFPKDLVRNRYFQ